MDTSVQWRVQREWHRVAAHIAGPAGVDHVDGLINMVYTCRGCNMRVEAGRPLLMPGAVSRTAAEADCPLALDDLTATLALFMCAEPLN